MKVNSETLLSEARDHVMERRWETQGVVCPCCDGLAKVYKRKITSTTARSLILMYQAHGLEWQHVPSTLGRQSADETKGHMWGLLEAKPGRREDGSRRTGWWRITPLGEKWIRNEVAIAKYIIMYNNKMLFKDKSERVTIQDALGTRFNYNDLMAGV